MTSSLRLLLLTSIIGIAHCSIYQKYYDEAYKITQAMTLDEKIGQTIQADFIQITNKNGTDPALALKYHMGSLLIAGDGVPDANGNVVELPTQQQKIKQFYLNGTMPNWQALANKFNNIGPQVTTADGKTFKIKLLLGTDAVHNNQHVVGTVLFPHNSGLACTHNPTNFYNQGYWTGVNVKTSGFNFAFAPTVAVSHNPQWGRFYETMGQEDSMIYEYGKQFVKGLQNIDANGTWKGVVGSAKHFFGDGSTMFGANQGDARVYNFKNYINHNIQGYRGAIASEIGTIMCSYSAINGIPMATSPWLGNLLRNKLAFDGFVISDYDELHRIVEQQLPTSFVNTTNLSTAYTTIMNAGMDMFMLPGYRGFRAITEYIEQVKIALKNNTVSTWRLDDAVTRILAVKMSMGLIEQVKGPVEVKKIKKQQKKQSVQQPIKVTTEYQDALQAARESLVLLKNDNKLLPVKGIKAGTLQYIVLVGQRIININHLSKNQLFRNFDNIGMQCGGWSLRWQGFEGNDLWSGNGKAANASSILNALGNLTGSKFQMLYPNYTTFQEQLRIDVEREQYLTSLRTLRKNMTAANTLIIGVVGQSPFSESNGDVGIPYCKNVTILGGDGCLYNSDLNPYLPQNQRTTLNLDYEKFDHSVISTIREQDKNIPLLTVLLTGRPMLINNITNTSSAVLAAWLPGTTGGTAIVDAITGDYLLRPSSKTEKVNTLAFDWPSTDTSLVDFPLYDADGNIPALKNPAFSVGYGLATTN